MMSLYDSVERLRCRIKYVLFFGLSLTVLYCLGLLSILGETDIKCFNYPLDIDVGWVVRNLKQSEDLRQSGLPESKAKWIRPINYYNFTFQSDCAEKCLYNQTYSAQQIRYNTYISRDNQVSTFRVVYIVKSAVDHFERRRTIRKTWGFEKRFSDVPMRTVFLLGRTDDLDVQSNVEIEQAEFRDIVQANFLDSYYNNTYKTMMAVKWAVKSCSNSKFYLFVDDDYYVSTKNLLKFLRNPLEYPAYLGKPVASIDKWERRRSQFIDIELPEDALLYSGFVFPDSRPQRFVYSKWYVPLEEYEYNRYPPYVTAGAIVLSKQTLLDMYYASFFTKHFRFDDIYVGILAKKLHIEPVHSPEFYFYRKSYSSDQDYKYVVASHGFGDPYELATFWDQQKMSGNA